MLNNDFHDGLGYDFDNQEKRLLKALAIAAIGGSILFILLFIFLIHKTTPVYVNLVMIGLYSLTFFWIKNNFKFLSRYGVLWLFIFQVSFYSFCFFDRAAGLHIYFLVIPFICIMISHYRLTGFKIFTILASVGLFLLGYMTTFRIDLIYPLSSGEAQVLSLIIMLSSILGMLYLLYLFTSDMRKVHDSLKQISLKDPLTGLYNRRYINERIEQLFNESRRYGLALSVIMVDIDNFKNINDSYGHLAGDEVLKTFGELLVSQTREVDVVGRFGGEEFIILLPCTTFDKNKKSLNRLLGSINDRKFPLPDGSEIAVTASMGGVSYDESMDDYGKLIQWADKALYEAKDTGKNRWVYHEAPNNTD
ncbi:MAG: GGDEF domain-containing protein [Spirochaetales bacterium]|nr:GGDEF domain-containing protein [Spirochaetales bacterium]